MSNAIARGLKQVLPKTVPEIYYWSRRRFSTPRSVGIAVGCALRSGKLAALPVPDSKRRALVRPLTADIEVFTEVFEKREYAAICNSKPTPRFLIDAGAHIGLATIYFATRFPEATIVAVEPNAGNFQLLRRNTAGLANVHAYQGGLWSHKTRLEIANPNAGTWAFKLKEGDGVEAFTIDELMHNHRADHIDLLKIDIEGSEVEVLSNSRAWMPNVRSLAIELHDRFRPGCSEALANAAEGFGFRRQQFGNVAFLERD